MATDNATAAGNDAIFSLEQMRGAYEHRALWLHYLAEKAVEDGENGPLHQAIRKCGLYHADVRFAPFTSMDDFDEVFQSEPAKSVFEMETIEKDEDTLSIDFHYCPLVEAWKKLGLPQDEISALCDIAMDGDRGIIEGLGCLKFESPEDNRQRRRCLPDSHQQEVKLRDSARRLRVGHKRLRAQPANAHPVCVKRE